MTCTLWIKSPNFDTICIRFNGDLENEERQNAVYFAKKLFDRYALNVDAPSTPCTFTTKDVSVWNVQKIMNWYLPDWECTSRHMGCGSYVYDYPTDGFWLAQIHGATFSAVIYLTGETEETTLGELDAYKLLLGGSVVCCEETDWLDYKCPESVFPRLS